MSYYPSYQRRTQPIMLGILFLIGVMLTIGLYYVKTKAQSARNDVKRLERMVEVEREAIIVLEAELAHMESPSRLAPLAERELGLLPVRTDNVVRFKDLDAVLPVVSEVHP